AGLDAVLRRGDLGELERVELRRGPAEERPVQRPLGERNLERRLLGVGGGQAGGTGQGADGGGFQEGPAVNGGEHRMSSGGWGNRHRGLYVIPLATAGDAGEGGDGDGVEWGHR